MANKRFEVFEDELEYWIHDHETHKSFAGVVGLDDLTDLLNEQDESIKKLENKLRVSTSNYHINRSELCSLVSKIQNFESDRVKLLRKINQTCGNDNLKYREKLVMYDGEQIQNIFRKAKVIAKSIGLNEDKH